MRTARGTFQKSLASTRPGTGGATRRFHRNQQRKQNKQRRAARLRPRLVQEGAVLLQAQRCYAVAFVCRVGAALLPRDVAVFPFGCALGSAAPLKALKLARQARRGVDACNHCLDAPSEGRIDIQEIRCQPVYGIACCAGIIVHGERTRNHARLAQTCEHIRQAVEVADAQVHHAPGRGQKTNGSFCKPMAASASGIAANESIMCVNSCNKS
jgi:hypothetical protein